MAQSKNSFGLIPTTDDFDPPAVRLEVSDEKRTARLSKTKAWKQVKEYIDKQQNLYRQYQPGINPAIDMTSDANWRVADCVVRELEALKQYVDTIANG